MKIFGTLIVTLLLLVPTEAVAVSGTCSYHGGVNCIAGMDDDGSTICNDGWRDSDELFDKTM